jgi:hypothetical protein
MILAMYWMFLLTGRLIAVAILPRVRHGRLLMSSMLSAIFGCLVLTFADNAFGASVGVCFVGAGFASIYPLVAEAIGRRFPYYHPRVLQWYRSRLPWSAACWRPPLSGTQLRYGGWAWWWGFRFWVRSW